MDLDVNPVFEGAMKIINGNNKPENISFEIKPIKNIRVDERENIYKAIFMSTNVNLYNSCVNLYPEIIKQEQKELFIEVLQIFDSNITDISITDDMIWIHSKKKNNAYVFIWNRNAEGLLLSLILVKSSGGIMLIDEIETAIHTSALIEVFSFIIKACKKLNVQLFATTHSLESVDKLLKAANYDEDFDEKNDIIRVITLRNSKKKTNARVLTGKQAFTNRNEYEMELRV
ncbi:MAG: AAA family ATPase [Faecalibacillus sp.]